MRGNRKSQPDTTYLPPDNVCQLLGQHLESGLNFTSFAGVLGISRQTLYNLLDRTPELKTTREKGEMKALLFYEKIRRNSLAGVPTTITIDGVEHESLPNQGALMFTLHTRFPAEYPRENEAAPIDQYEFSQEVAEQLHFLMTE